MPAPLAYFLTWTCYGTWLHGDERLSVDSTHNRRGTPFIEPDRSREDSERLLQMDKCYVLSDEARHIVDQTIRKHCDIRDWTLHALNVRTNHVHIVVDCKATCTPERAMEQFKAWSTRKLREAGLVEGDQRVWTEHGSTRWLNHAEGFDAAIRYVLYAQ